LSGLPWLSVAFHFLANLKCLQRCLGWRKIDNTRGEKLIPILAPRAPRSRERERERANGHHIATISPPGKQSEKRQDGNASFMKRCKNISQDASES